MIILNTYPRTARELLCQAYHLRKMHYPHYVWLLPGWFEENWWKEVDNNNKSDQAVCTQEEMKSMLYNSLGITEAPSDYLRRNKSALLVNLFVSFVIKIKSVTKSYFFCSINSPLVPLISRTSLEWHLVMVPHLQQGTSSLELPQQNLLPLHMTLFCYWQLHSTCKMHLTTNN